MNREQVRKQRLENPQKREKYLKDCIETSRAISEGLRKSEMSCNCDEINKDREEYRACMYCSLGQQSAELYDEGIGIEGVDY